jgi:hypothetical protein
MACTVLGTSPAGDKNDRHVRPIHSDALLQFEAIQSWKTNLKNETAWKGDSRAVEECSSGDEGVRLPACVADQKLQRPILPSTANTIDAKLLLRMKCQINGLKQSRVAERLEQALHRTLFH